MGKTLRDSEDAVLKKITVANYLCQFLSSFGVRDVEVRIEQFLFLWLLS